MITNDVCSEIGNVLVVEAKEHSFCHLLFLPSLTPNAKWTDPVGPLFFSFCPVTTLTDAAGGIDSHSATKLSHDLRTFGLVLTGPCNPLFITLQKVGGAGHSQRAAVEHMGVDHRHLMQLTAFRRIRIIPRLPASSPAKRGRRSASLAENACPDQHFTVVEVAPSLMGGSASMGP